MGRNGDHLPYYFGGFHSCINSVIACISPARLSLSLVSFVSFRFRPVCHESETKGNERKVASSHEPDGTGAGCEDDLGLGLCGEPLFRRESFKTQSTLLCVDTRPKRERITHTHKQAHLAWGTLRRRRRASPCKLANLVALLVKCKQLAKVLKILRTPLTSI